jgi:hypothetical protein
MTAILACTVAVVRSAEESIVRRALWLIAVGVLALVLTTVAQGLWTALIVANLRTTPAVPWSVVVMAIVRLLVTLVRSSFAA